MVSPFFFAVHLLDLMNKSDDLRAVLKAVTLNGRAILVTGVFGLIIIYIYAIVGFALFKDDFILVDQHESRRCSSY